MLLLVAGHIKFVYNVYNCNYKVQVPLMLKLFKIIEIHIIQVYSNTYYLSVSCIYK